MALREPRLVTGEVHGARAPQTAGAVIEDNSALAERDKAVAERLKAAARLNATLYAEVERHIASVDRAEQERDAWAAHARGLAQKLVQARKHVARLERQLAAATGQPVPQSGSHDDDAVSLANADEDARQLAKLLDIEQALAEAGQAGQNGSTASAQPAASGSFRLGSTQSVNAAAAYPASVLSAQNETRVAVAESDAAVAAVLAAGLAADAAAAVAMVPVNPTPNQQRVLEQLVQRGRSMGWLIQPSEVSLGPVLGEGEFGVTYRGTWRKSHVAAKVVRLRHAWELTSFLREIETMSYIRHPNVVPFLGACLSLPPGASAGPGQANGPRDGPADGMRLMLISEYMTGGTLADWLHPGGPPAAGTTSGGLLQPSRPLIDRLRMALQVAQGMCALEGSRPAILHRDLKPTNVYLDGGGACRVGDFGLARRLLAESRADLTGETGTYLYMAPEVMRHEVYDTKADVWSWGVLLSECIMCMMPYGHTYMTPVQVAQAVSAEQLAPLVPNTVSQEVQLVLRLACQFDPDMRPDFCSVADMLGAAIAHMEQQQTPRNTLLATLQSGLLSGWSSAWGWGTGYPRGARQQQHGGRHKGETGPGAGPGAAAGRLPPAASC